MIMSTNLLRLYYLLKPDIIYKCVHLSRLE